MKIQQKKLIALESNRNKEYQFTVKNNYEYSFKNQKIKIELLEEADGFILVCGENVRYPVEVVSRKQNRYEILVNGVGYTFSVETPFSLKRLEMLESKSKASKSQKIKAPMPGKILDVMVTRDQAVNHGDALFVLEAMKMQNTIVAPAKGKISRVEIKTGDTVAKDDLLMEMQRL